MSSNNNNNSPPQSPSIGGPNRRRSSIAEFFQPRLSSSPNGTPAFPSAMSTVMQSRQNNPRRMSVTTSLGLSGSPTNQTPTFSTYNRRRDSVSSSQDSGSPSNEESALDETDAFNSVSTPVTPFARRVSFGAQAFGSVRSGGGAPSNGTRRPSLNPLISGSSNHSYLRSASTTTPSTSRGEGFNWGDNLREKSGKLPQNIPGSGSAGPNPIQHQRSASIGTTEPPKQMPVHYAKPDVLGERMLRGDFAMD